MTTHLNQANLFARLQQQSSQQQTIVLTPNRRLSNHLLQAYHQWQHSQGRQTWPNPVILPINTWLEQCWQHLNLFSKQDQHDLPGKSLPQLLNHSQQLTLWQRIIRQHLSATDFFNVDACAELAQNAWNLLENWQITHNAQTFNVNQNSSIFYQWVKAYQFFCQQNSFIDSATLPKQLIPFIQNKQLPAPAALILACFDEIAPQIQQCLSAFVAQGTELLTLELTTANEATCLQTHFVDLEQEITSCAQWAKAELEKGNQSIGIVVPNLTTLRTKIERIFTQTFSSRHLFNLSVGLPLHEYPIIFSALQLLQLLRPQIDLVTVSLLLRTPFCHSSETEQHPRALLEERLRRLNTPMIGLNTLHHFAGQKNKPYYCPLLQRSVSRLMQRLPLQPRLASQWAQEFSQLLNLLGWPGERTLNSEEYQTVTRWSALLTEFASLDLVLEPLSYGTALKKLRELAGSTLFQPQSQPAAINILGLLEAAGLPFQKIWLLNLDNQTWPARAQPNPFIPFELQRQHQLPHATAQRELQFSQRMTERFSCSAETVIFSYHQMDGDQTLEASPLIAGLPVLLPTFATAIKADGETTASSTLESLNDHYGPAVSPTEKIAGGTFLLKEQAACPFRAFAKYRLNATGLSTTQLGLNPIQRGTLLHASLENSWQTLQNQQNLLSYSTDELTQLIATSIATAIKTLAPPYVSSFLQAIYQIEQQRLTKLLQRWFALEKNRPPFKIAALEQTYPIQFGNLILSMRIDRIDEIDDGSKLVIDYKSQLTVAKDWFGPRPTEPQLPLYCLTQDGITGLSFACIRSDKIGFSGISEQETNIEGIIPYHDFADSSNSHITATHWQEQKKDWQQTFNQLAQQFSQGDASVDPIDPPTTCRYCELTSFCRITELSDYDES